MNNFKEICTIKNNEIINVTNNPPTWFTNYYLNKIKPKL